MVLRVLCLFSLIVAHISTLPISSLQTEFPTIEIPAIVTDGSFQNSITKDVVKDEISITNVVPEVTSTINNTQSFTANATNQSRNTIRPGMVANDYVVELTPNVEAGTFSGLLRVQVSVATNRDDAIIFNIGDRILVHNVRFGLAGNPVTETANFNHEYGDSILEITTGTENSLYNFEIEYSGVLNRVGTGFFRGITDTSFSELSVERRTYLAMNLHPIHARHVFPCIDEPTEENTISFVFHNVNLYSNIVVNSAPEPDIDFRFRPITGAPHRWGMVAHNFENVAIPVASSVYVYGRTRYQDNQISQSINIYYNFITEWTDKPYTEIEPLNQDGRMVILALPDVDKTWVALSSVCIWEPYVIMESTDSVEQRATGLLNIAEAMSRQWFGYVLYPENWIHQWIISGLSKYAAYEAFKQISEISLLDVDTLFVTDVIQESLLQDAYQHAAVLLPEEPVFDENNIRGQFRPLVSYKAAAIFRLLRLSWGNAIFGVDPIQSAAQSLLRSRALRTINTQSLYDALTPSTGVNPIIGNDIEEFLDPYVRNTGYPLLTVLSRPNGVTVTQEHFTFGESQNIEYIVPVTYTTKMNPNFEDVYPTQVMRGSLSVTAALDEEDWILFNIQGQGYYRVDYDYTLWENIILALQDPDERQNIHPLNRATLVDDALNLARAGIREYDIAFQVVLAMEHERDYAVWKAFVRNMNFLRIRLEAYVYGDEDLDPDIYLRMVRRTIGTFERELGFTYDVTLNEPAMDTKLRGLVMDHACRAGYAPCIAAAVDWFYDPNNREIINPDIPRDLRPAVYCAMARTGDADVRNMLYDRLELEDRIHDRVVILESLGCTQDAIYITSLLQETLTDNSQYNTEERIRIFKAVAAGGPSNAQLAVNFLRNNAARIIENYGGLDRLFEIIFYIVEYLGNPDISDDFARWIDEVNSGIEDYKPLLDNAKNMANQNIAWIDNHLLNVYDWIDENDAPTLMISLILLCSSVMLTMFS